MCIILDHCVLKFAPSVTAQDITFGTNGTK